MTTAVELATFVGMVVGKAVVVVDTRMVLSPVCVTGHVVVKIVVFVTRWPFVQLGLLIHDVIVSMTVEVTIEVVKALEDVVVPMALSELEVEVVRLVANEEESVTVDTAWPFLVIVLRRALVTVMTCSVVKY